MSMAYGDILTCGCISPFLEIQIPKAAGRGALGDCNIFKLVIDSDAKSGGSPPPG